MKIRDLSGVCANLLEKLRGFVSNEELQEETRNLQEFSSKKSERFENLLKIKQEETFFRIKLQIIGLLQEFQVCKEDLSGIHEITSESALFNFLVKKLKSKLRDWRSREQESNYEIRKDRVLNQQNEERIHHLTETNELLKLTESKLKQKNEELRGQMTQFI